jgi:hypothetical protein
MPEPRELGKILGNKRYKEAKSNRQLDIIIEIIKKIIIQQATVATSYWLN